MDSIDSQSDTDCSHEIPVIFPTQRLRANQIHQYAFGQVAGRANDVSCADSDSYFPFSFCSQYIRYEYHREYSDAV